jgi:hypothetical protein
MTVPVLTDMLKETTDTTMTFRKTRRKNQNKMHQPGTRGCQEKKDSDSKVTVDLFI